MAKEKIYTFKTIKGDNGKVFIKHRYVLESELTKQQKDLLLGDLIKTWENQPPENKIRFLNTVPLNLSCQKK